MEINPLKLYKVNFTSIAKNKNSKTIQKSRPCVLIQMSPPSMYYGSTAYVAIPLSSNYHTDLENYKVQVLTSQEGYALVYNFVVMSDDKLISWKDPYTNKEVYISPEKLKEITDKLCDMIIMGGKMTLADFNKKPYSVEMMEKTEKLEKSNKSLEKSNKKLERSNKELKQETKELREDNKELKVMLKEILSYHRKGIVNNE